MINNIPYICLGYGISIGQNVGWGYASWDAAIQGWFDDVNHFRYGVGSINGRAVRHYTQVVFLKVFFLLADTFTCPVPKPLLWIPGGVSSGFQKQSGFYLICIVKANVMYIPSDPPLVLHVANLLMINVVGLQF